MKAGEDTLGKGALTLLVYQQSFAILGAGRAALALCKEPLLGEGSIHNAYTDRSSFCLLSVQALLKEHMTQHNQRVGHVFVLEKTMFPGRFGGVGAL